MSKMKPNQTGLKQILQSYLENLRSSGRDGTTEMEIRFGTARGMKPINRIEYGDVIQRFLSAGFQLSDAKYLLRVNSNFTDSKSGSSRLSNIRAELSGLDAITEYCKHNTIETFYTNGRASFIQKNPFTVKERQILPYDAPDYNMRASLSNEKDMGSTSMVRTMVSQWKDHKKIFRYMIRHTLTHPDFPLSVDVSIVKQSRQKGKYVEQSYTFTEAGLSKSPERYEIEIEMDNLKVGVGSKYSTTESLYMAVKKTILYVLSGLQGTNFPISYSEQFNLLDYYMRMIWNDKYKEGQRTQPKHFIGPSSVSLQLNNISEQNEDANYPNIRNAYTVTEKADGDRKLMMVADNGLIYLIDTNMRVQFTGAKTTNPELFGSILDGEHIIHNKEKVFINLYAAFDIYYLHRKDVRSFGFIGDKDSSSSFRLPLLNRFMHDLKPFSVTSSESPSPMRFEHKTFYSSSPTQTIFQASQFLLQRIDDDLFEYETDGLIFTPMNTGVGSNKIGVTTMPMKKTWEYSFKWKPPEFNTIDFMVTIQRDSDGREDIKHIYQNGMDVNVSTQITQYKTLILRVGFDESLHGYINPCLNVIEDVLPSTEDRDNEEGYKPIQFFPTNPSDEHAGICHLRIESAQGGTREMFTENREIIEDNTIVEFRYNMVKDVGWRWEPLRVRYDKTNELRNGGKNYGNAYHVANNNWHSIHNPVTKEMITSGNDIPTFTHDEDVYYNRVSNTTVTRGLRDFHNLYVKKKLIVSVSKPNDILIDYAVGMGGDFTKWIEARLKFVFGIDISRDNIENRLKGACARYLNYKKKYNRMPSALFIVGNSSVNIRDTNAMFTEKGKQITNAVFGKGPKESKTLGKGVYRHYGIAEHGFDVASIQFAMHYMFENITTLSNFLRNVSETVKVGGRFIGTCYDGSRVFNMLSSKSRDESIVLQEGTTKMWEVVKRYDKSEFPASEESLGYAVDIFMESIGKMFREYLVNFEYLDRLMHNFGFTLLSVKQANELGLPNGIGTFHELHALMYSDTERAPNIRSEYGLAYTMTEHEKMVSFLNNYFIYVKTHAVDAKSVSEEMIRNYPEQTVELPVKVTEVDSTVEPKVPKSVKLKKKLKLVMENK